MHMVRWLRRHVPIMVCGASATFRFSLASKPESQPMWRGKHITSSRISSALRASVLRGQNILSATLTLGIPRPDRLNTMFVLTSAGLQLGRHSTLNVDR